MLMERKLTINNSVCGRWFLCLIALFLMSVGMQAEETSTTYTFTGMSAVSGEDYKYEVTSTSGEASETWKIMNFSATDESYNNRSTSGYVLETESLGISNIFATSTSATIIDFQLVSDFVLHGNFVSAEITYSTSGMSYNQATVCKVGNSSYSMLTDTSEPLGTSPATISLKSLYEDKKYFNGQKVALSFTFKTNKFDGSNGAFSIQSIKITTTPPTEVYNLWVGGVQVNSGNASNILNDDNNPTAVFDLSSNTLTLNGATVNGNVVSGLADGLTVHLVGTNTINTQGTKAFVSELQSEPSLTFTAANGGLLKTNILRTEGDAVISSGFNFSKNSDIPEDYKMSWDADGYCSLGKYYGLYLYAFVNGDGYFQPYYVTAANCDRLMGKYNESNSKWDNTVITISYDDSEKTLTLNNASPETAAPYGDTYLINCDEANAKNITIMLLGENTLRQYPNEDAAGFIRNSQYEGTVTITTDLENPGTLTMPDFEESKEESSIISADNVIYKNGLGYSKDENNVRYIKTLPGYGLKVAGITVNSSNADNVLGDDLSEEGSVASVSFDATTNTLTLNEAWIDASNNEAIVSDLANLTIFLVGENGINGSNGFTFNKSSSVEKATITFTTDEESNGSLYIYNLEERLFGAGVTPAYTDVSIKHVGDSHTIDSQLGIRVGGVPVTLFNKDNVLGDGKVSYNPETYTLTLNNATIEPEEETSGIVHSNAENLKIALIGNNSIRGGEGCSAISHYGGVETYSLSFAKGNAAQHFSLTLIAQSENDLINGFDTNYGDFFVFDNEDDGTYTSTISSSVFGGTGTAAEPFLIKTAEDLKDFAYNYNEGRFSNNVHIQLFNDINCKDEEGFSTIADNTDATFYGVFDGNHKTISNLTMTGVGFFGFVSKDDDFGVGTITNLTLSNFNLTGKSDCDATGGIVAELSDGAIVSNCSVENSIITCASNNSNPEVGGIVGRLNNSTITGCTVNNVQVKAETTYTGGSGTSSNAGGIVGYISQGTISACEVENGTIRSSHVAANGYQSAGGIVGSCDIDEVITISNNMVKGSTTVSAEDNTPEGVSGTPIAGAVVGQIGKSTALSNNTYEYTVTVSTKPSDAVATTVSGYTQRGSGNKVEFEGTDNYPELYVELNDLFEDNGAVMYTKSVALPAESDQVTVMGEEGNYYSTDVVSDAVVLNVAPGQTATLNAIPGDGLAIASLTATNTTSSEAITTTSTMIEAGTMQYTFTMPDAPVTVAVTTATAYGVTVGGVAVTEQNYSDVLGDHKVSFDVETNTLTLNGATINGGIRCGLDGALTVHLQGQNVIDGGYVDANNNGERAFVGELQTTKLQITTDTENPGQLLLKRPYVNQYNNAEYYSDYMYPSFKNGLVESENHSDKKVLIAQGPVVTPGEGLYWTDQQYTIPTGTQISCSNNAGQPVDVSVNANSFNLTATGKYTISISKAVTVDDTNFSLSNSGHYIVHNKPGFSDPAGSYTDSKTITLTNLPTLPENPSYYPQVWYYLDENKNDSVQYTSAEQTITLTSSAKVCVYFLDEDSGKVAKSANVETEYTILKTPNYHFSTSSTGDSYTPSGGTLSNLDYGDPENVLPWLINVPDGLDITYSSSDEIVATISSTGEITLTGAGYVWISASNEATDVYAAHEERIRLEIRPSDPIISLEHGIYYTGQQVTMTPTVPNGTMYYRFGENGDWVEYNVGDVITLPKGEVELFPFTRCGTEELHKDSYGNGKITYFVYDEPTFSVADGTYNAAQQVTIGNLPTDGDATVYYYFYDETLQEEDANMVEYHANDVINVTESSILKALIARVDTGKQIRTQPVEAQYVIRQDAGLAYTQNNESVEVAEYTIGGKDNEELPELENESNVAVTYTSGDEQVATVDATGKVTIVGIGETTITATSAQTATLLAGEASYVLKVYKDLNYESITVSVATATYTGEAVNPVVKVMDGETDVTDLMIISYDNNIEVGDEASVTIVPNDDLEVNFYVGSTTQTFSIVNRTLEIGKDVNFASGQKWASFYTTTENLELPDGVMAYIVTAVSTEAVTVKAINYVPKNVPVLIENESTTTTDNTSAEGNQLQGTSESTAVSAIEGHVYVLYNGGFTRATSGAIPAGRAYLVLEQEASARLLIVEEEATDISEIERMSNGGNESWYSLDGQKLQKKPTKKGMYIVNGQKVVIK